MPARQLKLTPSGEPQRFSLDKLAPGMFPNHEGAWIGYLEHEHVLLRAYTELAAAVGLLQGASEALSKCGHPKTAHAINVEVLRFMALLPKKAPDDQG